MSRRVVLCCLVLTSLAVQAETVDRWLTLGPVPAPFPAFHEETPGGFDLQALLDSDFLPARLAPPKEGSAVNWPFAEEAPVWVAADAAGGKLTLASPGEAPQVAWLSAYLDLPRAAKIELVLAGAHPRRLWVGGEEPVSGVKADDVKKEVSLGPGKHRVLVQTVRDPDRDEEWSVSLSFDAGEDAAAAAAGFTLDPVRGIDVADIVDAATARAVAVSRDGKLAAMIFRRTVPGTSKSESWIEVRSTKDGQIRWSMPEDDVRQIAFVPGEEKLSYSVGIAGDEESRASILVANIESGRIAPLIEREPRLGGYRWLADGSGVVYARGEKPDKDERGVKRVESLYDRRAGFRDKRHLWMISTDGVKRRLTSGPRSAVLQDVADDGRHLLLSREADDVGDRPFSLTEIWELDLGDLSLQKLTSLRWFNGASYEPGGRRLLIHAGPSAFGGAGANVPAGATPNDYDGQLYLWDPAADQVDPLTRDFDPAVAEAVWSGHDGKVYVRAADKDFVRLFRCDVKRKACEPVPSRVSVLQRIAVADAGPTVVATGSAPWVTQRVVNIDLKSNEARTLVWSARDHYRETRRGSVEPWSFTASSGRTIDGRIYLPPDFDASRKYPCIVYYYGGTMPTNRAFGGRYPKEYWASLGYVVYVPQPSGAIGYGQAFSALHVNDWGEIVADEILEGVGKFLDAHAYVDRERVGCIGASFGGFMTMRLVTKSDLFAAAVSHAGISSIAAYWGEGYWGYQYSSIATADSYPWNRADLYTDRSPLFAADKVKTPLLLTHGTVDTNVPVGESDAFFTALKLVEAPVEYLQVAGENHSIVERDKRILWSRSIAAWFDRWLKEEPEWWDQLHPERK